jgi:UDP-glucose-4-epimerase GalE
MNKHKPHVIVTGGAGYIGSHVCKVIADHGFIPVSIDLRPSSTVPEFLKSFTILIEGDFANRKLLGDVVKDYRPDAVIHMAAFAYVGESMSQPAKYFENNTSKTAEMIATLTGLNVKKFIFSSSCATYGIPQSDSISESHKQDPINPYGWSKLNTENLLRAYSQLGKLDFVGLRYFNAAGASPSFNLGEEHEPETHVLPNLVKASLSNEEFKIFGYDYDTPDGSAVRDFVHVEDIALAHLASLNYLLNGGRSEFTNLGTGKGTSILELVSVLNELGNSVKVEINPRRPGDPDILVADPSFAKRLLGWSPRHDIKEILSTEIQWQRTRY